MNDALIWCWLRVRKAGWFSSSAIGLPTPQRWQGWLAFTLLIVLVAATVRLHGEAAFLVRVLLGGGYVALSIVASD